MDVDKIENDKTNELVHQQAFKIRIHEISHEGKLTIPSLLSILQEASMQHIIKLKASIWDLKEQSISWILLSKQLKIERLPERGEKITVLTYPTGFEKFFAYRDYLVFDSDKNLIATAATKWSLIDTNTRKISRVPESLLHLYVGDDIKKLARPVSRISTKIEFGQVTNKAIGSYDLDWNGHVNNIVLCKMMLQSLLSNGVKESDVKVVDIQFKNESHEGDVLDISVSQEGSLSMIRKDEKLVSILEARS